MDNKRDMKSHKLMFTIRHNEHITLFARFEKKTVKCANCANGHVGVYIGTIGQNGYFTQFPQFTTCLGDIFGIQSSKLILLAIFCKSYIISKRANEIAVK